MANRVFSKSSSPQSPRTWSGGPKPPKPQTYFPSDNVIELLMECDSILSPLLFNKMAYTLYSYLSGGREEARVKVGEKISLGFSAFSPFSVVQVEIKKALNEQGLLD